MSNKMDFYDRIESGEFETKIPRPVELRKPWLRKYSTKKDEKEYAQSLAEYEAALPAYTAAVAAHVEDQRRFDAIFKTEAIIDVFGDDASRFPATIESLWSIAEARSYSDGSGSMGEIYGLMVDMSVVIESIKKDLKR